ncbi:MAG: hypothetical protein ACP6KW_02155 [Candidatus Thorarchaeota archaeon]
MPGRPPKREPDTKEIARIHSRVREKIGTKSLQPWQQACRAFAPFNYSRTTRKEWFRKNQDRVRIGREIVGFVDRMTAEIAEDEQFKGVRKSAIKKEVVKGIRKIQEKQGITVNRLNEVKVDSFRTLVSWAEDPERLEQGRHLGRETLPQELRKKRERSKRGRKSAKGKYGPPVVHLAKDTEISDGKVILTCAIENRYLHPYQNVMIQLDVGEGVSVHKVSPFRWNASKKSIHVGFVMAGLDVEPLETEFTIELSADRGKKHSISGTVFYDDTSLGDKGKAEIEKVTFST